MILSIDLLRATCLAVAFAVLPLAMPTGALAEMSASQIEESLTCQCGCGLTVGNCNHVQCGFGIPVKDDIAASLAKGETGEEILARYRAEYGEKILSSPTWEGFNIVAWVAPYIAIFVAGCLMLLSLRRLMRRKSATAPTENTEATAATDSADRERLARALEDYDA